MKENHLGIVAMHPHAIIPLHAFLYAGFCDQFIPELYGVGTTTDGALWLPILRHILQYLSVGSAHKQSILYAMQQLDQNLFILPGGVAEIFLSHRYQDDDDDRSHVCSSSQQQKQQQRTYVQTIKARRYGLMKLALETGAILHPVYVFGATDIFDQLTPTVLHVQNNKDKIASYSFSVAGGRCLESISRRIRGGLTLYWGKWFLPIPHTPRLTMVMGDPIHPWLDHDKASNHNNNSNSNDNRNTHNHNHKHNNATQTHKRTCPRIKNPTTEQVEELMTRYVDALQRLFEQYKVQAGYPNDVLEIQ